MRILLTGGAGFIGSHVAERLLGRGHEVAVVDDLSSGKRENVPGGAAFYELDVRSGCARAFEEFAPQALCHQAAQMDVRRSVGEPDFDAEVNVLGTVRLLENCAKHGVGKVVFASSGGAVYGEQEAFPATEDHPQYPLSPYGVSKLAGERYLNYYRVQYGILYAALRYANVYGPRQDPHGEAGVVAIFCGNLEAGKPSTINGTGGRPATTSTSGTWLARMCSPWKKIRPPARTTSGPASRPASTSSTSCCRTFTARTSRRATARQNPASSRGAALTLPWPGAFAVDAPRWAWPRVWGRRCASLALHEKIV